MKIRDLAFTAVCLLLAASVRAGVTTYNDSTSWNNALGGASLTTLTFDNTVPPYGVNGSDGLTYGGGPSGAITSSLVDSGVTFNAYSQVFYVSTNVYWDAGYQSTDYLDWQNGGSGLGSLTVNLPSPVTAFGFQIGSFNSSGGLATVTVDGTPFSISMPSNAYGFFGVTSTTGISSFSVQDDTNWAVMDNLQFTSQSQPHSSVPDGGSTLAMVLVAAATLMMGLMPRRTLAIVAVTNRNT
ncbi:MAG TPA: hypothetical protein VHE61_02525 [Opitutaceae bacterium]|nr:hypothetical protein [Opitutaceae bacterium]